MNLQVENLEKNMAKLTVEAPAEQFDDALKAAYHSHKGRFSIPGFRKGKAPMAMIEKMYGAEIFYEEAANLLLDATYPDAVEQSGLAIVSKPKIDLVQIKKGEPFVYTALVVLKPEVTLGAYKGIEVEKASAEVTDEDVEKELKKVQEQNSRLLAVEDRPIADKDEVIIDFEGFVDGKTFEGGKSENYSLRIGSHSFVDTFEEQLIGKSAGEECEVHVTFPEDYHAPGLAGKPAMFRVTVKQIKERELPELNDEFAGEVSEFETLEEYKADIRAKLSETKQRQATTENENRVVEKVVENAAVEIPEPMIEAQSQRMLNDFVRKMQLQGMSFEQYLTYMGTTAEQMKQQARPQAEKTIRTRLVLEAVVKAENLAISQERLQEEMEKIAASSKLDLATVKTYMGELGIEQAKEDLAIQDAVDFLVAEAKLV